MDRLEHARWILERNLQWIAAAETKTAVILSINMAMLGALAVAFSALEVDQRTAWATVLTVIAGIPLAVSVIFGAKAVWPETDGPEKSFIFFGRIKDWKAETYPLEFRDATDTAILQDCLAQIHRNAEIAGLKHTLVTISLKLAFIAAVPWIASLAVLVSARH